MTRRAPRDWLIWLGSLDPGRLSRPRRWMLWTTRIALALAHDLTRGPLPLWAMSLVYTTLLSLVPLLALAFSVLKAFGVHNVAEPVITDLLAPLGPQGVELTARIIGFVENMKVGVLGSVGLGFLLYTVVSLIQKVERAFNQIWRVNEARSLARSFKDYLIVVLLAPVLYLVSTGLFASIMGAEMVRALSHWQPFGLALSLIARLAPIVLITTIFTLIYLYLPNTKVRWHAALAGALVATLAWLIGGRAFAFFVSGSTNYDAIYSSFAILILLLIWLNVVWTILLTGAQIAFYIQYPAAVLSQASLPGNAMTLPMRAQWTLTLLHTVGQRHLDGEPPLDLDALATTLGLWPAPLRPVEASLVERGLLLRSRDDPPRLGLAIAPEHIRLNQILMSPLPSIPVAGVPALQTLIEQVNAAGDAILAERTLADLLKHPTTAVPPHPDF